MRRGRFYGIVLILLIIVVAMIARVVHLQVLGRSFFRDQGASRSVRVVTIPAERGMILDRWGTPLAVTTQVFAVAADPQTLTTDTPQWVHLLTLLHLKATDVQAEWARSKKKHFMYLARQVPPALAAQVQALKIPGVMLETEYRRYYPEGDSTAQLLGFTNIDGVGQEGIEAYDNRRLTGISGQKVIERDLLGRVVSEQVRRAAIPGQTVTLSIDQHIQAIAYQAVRSAVIKNKAVSGFAMIEAVRTGEVLAMVGYPAFNPNNRGNLRSATLKNRALTDVFEPGSTMKPLAMAAVLQSGKVPLDTTVNTAPGYIQLGGNVVRDTRNEGTLTLFQIIEKSSNVGISKLVTGIQETQLLPNMLRAFGFGQKTALDFPGESHGVFPAHAKWSSFMLATLSFGYGISVTEAQLLQAYATLADDGRQLPLTLIRPAHPKSGKQVIRPDVAQTVLAMLTQVVQVGTGQQARVSGFEVAGKTGTVRKAIAGGYAADSYLAIFAGIIPANAPQLAMVIVIDDPRGDKYYGGSVAAPVFAQTMRKVMPILKA